MDVKNTTVNAKNSENPKDKNLLYLGVLAIVIVIGVVAFFAFSSKENADKKEDVEKNPQEESTTVEKKQDTFVFLSLGDKFKKHIALSTEELNKKKEKLEADQKKSLASCLEIVSKNLTGESKTAFDEIMKKNFKGVSYVDSYAEYYKTICYFEYYCRKKEPLHKEVMDIINDNEEMKKELDKFKEVARGLKLIEKATEEFKKKYNEATDNLVKAKMVSDVAFQIRSSLEKSPYGSYKLTY